MPENDQKEASPKVSFNPFMHFHLRHSILASCSAERSAHSRLPMLWNVCFCFSMQAPEAAEEPSTKQKAAASLLQAAKDGSLEKSLQDFEQKAATPEAKLWHGQGFHVTPHTDTEAEAEHDARVVRELAELLKAFSQYSPILSLSCPRSLLLSFLL